MLLSPHPQETANLFRTDLEELQSTYSRHGVPFGTPADLIAFPRTLSLNQGLSSDFAGYIAAIQRRGAGRLSLAETVTILVLSLGGPEVLPLEDASIQVEEATELLSGFLITLGGWTRADLGLAPRSRSQSGPPEPSPEPVKLEGPHEVARPYLVSRDEEQLPGLAPGDRDTRETPAVSKPALGTSSLDAEPTSTPDAIPHPEAEAAFELSDTELQARLHDETPGSEPASPVAELNQVLARLELTSLELKHHLDSIDQRISRMEPRIESMPATLPSQPVIRPVSPPHGSSRITPPATRFASAGLLDRSGTALPAWPDTPAPAIKDGAKWPSPAAASPPATLAATAVEVTTTVAPREAASAQPRSRTDTPAPAQESTRVSPALDPLSGTVRSSGVPGPDPDTEDRRRLLRSFEAPERSASRSRPRFNRRRQRVALAAIVLVTLLGFGAAIVYLLDPDLSHGITVGSYTFGAENPYRSRSASIPKAATPPPAPEKVPRSKAAPVAGRSVSPETAGQSAPSASAPSSMVLDSPVPHVNVYSARQPKPGSLTTTFESSTGRVSVPSTIMAANLDSARLPIYPHAASLIHLQGVVVLQTNIAKNGSVESVTPLGGHPLLRGAAVDAVRRWHYRPYVVDGHPVEVSTVVSVDFNLDQR